MIQARPILCLDFDGVIHSYERGWQNGELYGSVTPGFWDWALKAEKLFKLVIYSSRSGTEGEIAHMKEWLSDQWEIYKLDFHPSVTEMPFFTFADRKPPAFLTVDDRCVCFKGNWNDLDPELLVDFKPWNATVIAKPEEG